MRNWKKGTLLIGIIIGLIIWARYGIKTTQTTQTERVFASPDSVTAYRLSSQDENMLAEWQELQGSGKPHSLHNWVRERYLPLQNIGLKLLEHVTINFAQGNQQLATSKMDICTAIAKTLAEAVGDSFLWDQIQFFNRLNERQLQTRAVASALYANAYDKVYARSIEEAQELYGDVVELAQEISDDKLQIDAMVGLQYTYYYKSQHHSGIDIGKKIVKKAEQVGYRRRLSIALQQIADAYRYLDQYHDALETLDKAVSIAVLMNDRKVLIRSYFSQAQLYYRMENYQNAEKALQNLSEIDSERKYSGLVNLVQGRIHAIRGEYGLAQTSYENAAKIFRSKNDQLNEAASLSNLALLYSLMGEYHKALELEQQSLKIKKEKQHSDLMSSSLSNIGLYYYELDSLDEAIRSLQDALQLLPSGSIRRASTIWVGLGDAQLKKGDLQAATESFTKAGTLADSIGFQMGKVDAFICHGRVALKRGQLENARKYFSEAVTIADNFNYPDLVSSALFGLSIVERESKNYDEAARTLELAIKSSEELREGIYQDSLQISFFATTQELFDEAILLSLTRGQKELAFRYGERARARALLDALGHTTVEELENRESFEMFETHVPSLNELMKSIPYSVQVIEYRLTPDTLLIWLLDNNKLVFRRMPYPSKAIEHRVKEYLSSIGATNLAAFRKRVQQDIETVYFENRQLGRELYKLLVEPIADELSSEKQLCIIPDGYLHRLPFGSLATDDERFFDERFVWSKAPSLTILYEGLKRHKNVGEPQNSHFLMVAAGDLPSTTSQKKWIERLFSNSTVLEKSEANYQALKDHLSDKAEILYLSVHAVADERHPMSSYIELYSDNASNGQLTLTKVYARQLLQLDFSNAWLAVLNACETATGKIAYGEGVLNMVRILSLGGVEVCVASLWKNDDRRSAEIIGKFYEGLVQGHGVSDAMHQAKKDCISHLRNDGIYPLPYFWAVFEVYENSWLNQNIPKSIQIVKK
ncbi:MAG: CHAT domain-containing protein [bacterium]